MGRGEEVASRPELKKDCLTCRFRRASPCRDSLADWMASCLEFAFFSADLMGGSEQKRYPKLRGC
jgi:hypothetical protein